MNYFGIELIVLLYVLIHGLGWVKPKVGDIVYYRGWQMWVLAPLVSVIHGAYYLFIGIVLSSPLLAVLYMLLS